MPELKIVWRNPNSQLRVPERRIQKCELSPEFYGVQELVSSGGPALWFTLLSDQAKPANKDHLKTGQ